MRVFPPPPPPPTHHRGRFSLLAYPTDLLSTRSYDADTDTELLWPKPERDADAARGRWRRSRARLLRVADRVGAAREALECPARHIVLVYNPISGGGKSKALVDDVVVPIFRLCGVGFTLVRTEFQGFCTKYIQTLAPGACDCVAIAGGDGLLLEAVTGYRAHSDPTGMMSLTPLACIPTGTANAMAHELHSAECEVREDAA
jgi:hypothetical protein